MSFFEVHRASEQTLFLPSRVVGTVDGYYIKGIQGLCRITSEIVVRKIFFEGQGISKVHGL